MKNTAKIENRKWKIVFLGGLVYFLLSASSVQAAFQNSGATARVAALGNSYVALANDAAALTMNPAGLGSVSQGEVITEYSRLSVGLTDNSQISQSYLGGATRLPFGGAVAFGWKQLNFDNLYTERTLSMGYGQWWTPRWGFGASLKQLHVAYNPPNQVVDDYGNIQSGTPDLFAQNGTGRTAYSSDIGALYKWSARSTVGLSVQDINEPNVALSSNDRDVVARNILLGMASEIRPNFNLAMGVNTQEALPNQRDWIWTGGLERLWPATTDSGSFGLRGSVSAGSRDYVQGALGASYGIGSLQFDYAFTTTMTGITLGETAGNHRFSMSYHFGSDPQKNLVLAPASGRSSSLSEEQARKATDVDLLITLIPSPGEADIVSSALSFRKSQSVVPNEDH